MGKNAKIVFHFQHPKKMVAENLYEFKYEL